MRFIGNKENLLDRIKTILDKNGVYGNSFFDFFSGTTSVAKYFKKLGFHVFSSDILYFSYCLQKAYIENNAPITFSKLLPVIGHNSGFLFCEPHECVLSYLNLLSPFKGFIYNNYTPTGTKDLAQPRMYFTDENGAKIDAIRLEIERLKEKSLISDYEYYFLLAALIESVPFYSNIAGVYAAFHKKWDPRALKPFELKPITPLISDKKCSSFCDNSLNIIGKVNCDILYLDPPYNERQYPPNYHLLETIARYDYPKISGVTGMRDYNDQKSDFCNARKALEALDNIAKNAKYKFLILSYSSEGIMKNDSIIEVLGRYGKVSLDAIEYIRFKSNSNGVNKNKRTVQELVYILRKK